MMAKLRNYDLFPSYLQFKYYPPTLKPSLLVSPSFSCFFYIFSIRGNSGTVVSPSLFVICSDIVMTHGESKVDEEEKCPTIPDNGGPADTSSETEVINV